MLIEEIVGKIFLLFFLERKEWIYEEEMEEEEEEKEEGVDCFFYSFGLKLKNCNW